MIRKAIYSLALTGLLTLAGGAALAQDNAAPPQQGQGDWGHGRRGMNADAQLKHLTKQLDLSAEQQGQIKPILESRDQQMKQLWQDQSIAQQDRFTKMKAIRDDSKAKIEAVLNDTQKQKYEAMQARMMEHGRGPGSGPGGEAPAPQPQ
jgi:periplasmic protein CpxP/Spy